MQSFVRHIGKKPAASVTMMHRASRTCFRILKTNIVVLLLSFIWIC